MDTGHFISFHADSPGNKAHNIERGQLWVRALSRESRKRALAKHECIFNGLSCIIECSTWRQDSIHVLFSFFPCLCWLQPQHVCLVVDLQLTAVMPFLVFRIIWYIPVGCHGVILHISTVCCNPNWHEGPVDVRKNCNDFITSALTDCFGHFGATEHNTTSDTLSHYKVFIANRITYLWSQLTH